jgi:hypothetical protein
VDQSVLLWILGICFTVLSALTGFLYRFTKEVREEATEQVEGLRREMQQQMQARFEEGRNDRAEIWREVRQTQRDVSAVTQAMTERLAKVPTREEFRADLGNFEARIERMLTGRPARSASH